MAEAFDLQNLILLINQEIQSAVRTGMSGIDAMAVEQVRVRMGQEQAEQDETNNISLSKELYPVAENGWLLDVVYRPEDNIENKFQESISPQKVDPLQWRLAFDFLPVIGLQGIGSARQKTLSEMGIHQIKDLAKLDLQELADHPSWLRSILISAQSLLLPAPISLPESILNNTVLELIKNPALLRKAGLSLSEQEKTHFWLYQLELALDNHLLQQQTLAELLSENKLSDTV